MVFGMWGRPPYSKATQNANLWAWVDSSGLAANSTEMLGWWADEPDWHSIITSSDPSIKATAYIVQPDKSRKQQGQVIVALASWAKDQVSVSLTIDSAALAAKIQGWDPRKALIVEAPAIATVQNLTVSSLLNIEVPPRGGALLTVRQSAR